jgi:hypothetical protein
MAYVRGQSLGSSQGIFLKYQVNDHARPAVKHRVPGFPILCIDTENLAPVGPRAAFGCICRELHRKPGTGGP